MRQRMNGIMNSLTNKLATGLVFATVLFGGALANAESQETPVAYKPRLEFLLGAGSAKQTGYLTQEDAATTFNMAIHFYAPNGLFSFEWSDFSANHDTGEFSLANNYKVRVSTFGWMSFVDVLKRDPLTASLGIGLIGVTTSQYTPDDYRTTYGTFALGGLVRYQFNDNWALHLKSEWYNVEQSVAGKTTSFEVWNNSLSVGYHWN